MNQHPKLTEFKFTNFQLNYLHYIVYIHNNELLRSCVKLERTHKDILESTDNCGNKLIQTAVICNNKEALEILMRFYNRQHNDDTRNEVVAKWCNMKGQTGYSLAEQKENKDILSILNGERWTVGTNMKMDTDCYSIPENPKIPRIIDELTIERGASKNLSYSKRKKRKRANNINNTLPDRRNDELMSSVMSSRTRQLLNNIEADDEYPTGANIMENV